MVYNNYNGTNTLRPRILYALYIAPNDNGKGHLIFKLSTKMILATIKYQPIHAPEDLIETINEEDLFNNRIQTNHFNSENCIPKDDNFDNTEVTFELTLIMRIILKIRVMMNKITYNN